MRAAKALVKFFAIAQTRQSFAGVKKKGWFILKKLKYRPLDLFQDNTRVFPCLFIVGLIFDYKALTDRHPSVPYIVQQAKQIWPVLRGSG